MATGKEASGSDGEEGSCPECGLARSVNFQRAVKSQSGSWLLPAKDQREVSGRQLLLPPISRKASFYFIASFL